VEYALHELEVGLADLRRRALHLGLGRDVLAGEHLAARGDADPGANARERRETIAFFSTIPPSTRALKLTNEPQVAAFSGQVPRTPMLAPLSAADPWARIALLPIRTDFLRASISTESCAFDSSPMVIVVPREVIRSAKGPTYEPFPIVTPAPTLAVLSTKLVSTGSAAPARAAKVAPAARPDAERAVMMRRRFIRGGLLMKRANVPLIAG
jgi:hypothetical protein